MTSIQVGPWGAFASSFRALPGQAEGGRWDECGPIAMCSFLQAGGQEAAGMGWADPWGQTLGKRQKGHFPPPPKLMYRRRDAN